LPALGVLNHKIEGNIQDLWGLHMHLYDQNIVNIVMFRFQKKK
jgi:hypothetical protein